MKNLTICEICGSTFEQTENDNLDVCYACRKPAKKQKKEKKPSSTLANAIKRVMKGQTSKALKVRVCGVSLDRVISDADKMGERMEDIEINGIVIAVHQLKDKIQITYKMNNKVISGYYQ